MICKLLILGIKNQKMNNQVFIPSHGIGEMYLDVSDMFWYYYESSLYNIDTEIPFIKLLLEMSSLCMRYYTRLNGSAIRMPQVVLDIGCLTAEICRSFIKIKHLSKDVFSTDDIITLDYCMEVYRQYKTKEALYFFIAATTGITEALFNIDRELFNLRGNLEQIFSLFYGLLPKKSKFRNDLYETEQISKWNLMRQFSKLIRTDGIYSFDFERDSVKFFVSNL